MTKSSEQIKFESWLDKNGFDIDYSDKMIQLAWAAWCASTNFC